jgi:biopolymer transport protein ExbD
MAATMGGRGKARGMIVGINVTPMVDVVLVLLVIMMVSATYIASQSMRVDLPNAATSDGAVPSIASVTIAADGTLRFDDQPVSEAELVAHLHAIGGEHDLTLVVSADTHAEHGNVIHVLDLARVEGITSFAVNVERD